jgi:hypothetical protein
MVRRSWSNFDAPRRRPSLTAAPVWRRRRRGVAALLAMLYLVIFSTLALGFYSAVTTAAQVAQNDERVMNAQVATESGLQFIRYQLSLAKIPGDTPNNKILEEVFKTLSASKPLQPQSDNMSGRTIAMLDDTIYVPSFADGHYIALDEGGSGFRAAIVDVGDGSLLVKVTGRYRGILIRRAILLQFVSVTTSTNIFDYGIVTRGPIRMTGNASISGPDNVLDGSVLSTYESPTQTTMTGKASIGGDLYLVDKDAAVSFSGQASVGGSTISSTREEHVHRGTPEPEFPTVDTSIFLPFATNTYKSGKSVYTNTLVPAGSNPTFSGDTTIEGVLYIKQPNKVHFSGQTTIRGVIVVENGASSTAGNQISFSGGVTAYGIETLPQNDPRFPPKLLALQGSALLAPGFDVTLTGHSGVFGGAMVADSFTFTGGAGGDVRGTMIGMAARPFDLTGGGSITRRPSKVPIPAGLLFVKTFRPVPETYLEVHP